MKKYKIALVSDWFLPRIGGIELQVRDLALHLRENGQEVHVITTTPGFDLLQGVVVHRLQVPLLPFWKIAYNRRLIEALREIFMRQRFDVVHSHSSVVTPLAYAAVYVAHHSKIPNLITNHSLLEKSATILRLLDAIYQWRKWPTLLTSISTIASQGFLKASGRSEIPLLPNGIETKEWEVDKKSNSSLVQIAAVMRLHRKKRGLILIEAIAKVKRKLSKPIRFRLNILGDGPERGRLERRVEALGLQEEVKFFGTCSRDQIKKLFEDMDFFALPTLKEAFGIAVLEAKAAGLPVVAMGYGGVRDVIQHRTEGLLANNDEEFADHLLELIQNEGLRDEMSTNTKKTLSPFDWSEVIQKHLKVYEWAIKNSY